MAINYAAKHAQEIDERFSAAAITEPAVNKDYDFVGVKTVVVHSVPTVAMHDYQRSGLNRYGTPEELSDETQELTMSQDKAFTFTVDKGNEADDPALNAGKALNRQIAEVIAPMVDRYRLGVMVSRAGGAAYGATTKSNAYETFLDLNGMLNDANAPVEGRLAYASTSYFKLLKQDSSFIRSGDLPQNMLISGQLGEVDGVRILPGRGRLPDGVEDPAILSADGRQVWPLSWLGLSYETLSDAIPFLTPQVRAGLSLAIAGIPALPIEAVTPESPIPSPAQDVICLGINYMAHSDEAEKYSADAFATKHQDAIYFSKRVTRAVPDGGFIEAHTDLVKKLDYECELAVVLGKDAKDVPAGQTKDCVFGYTILNDVSARDVQTAHKQWYFGKSLDGFTPIGPCIVTADEFDTYPPKLPIRCFVNGEKRQDSNTGLQIFNIDHVIRELSQGMTLKAGTLIATGTPAGVAMGMEPPRFLQPGDVVRCEIDGIGSLTNTVG